MLSEKGMTLTEVLISVAILAIGSVYVLRALSTISYAQVLTENQAASYAFSASKLAEVEAALAAGKEGKKEKGRFQLDDERSFDWVLDYSSYNEEMKLDTVNLDVRWQQGIEKYNFAIQLLTPSPNSDEKAVS